MPSVVDPLTTVRLFADDTLIYRVIHSIEDSSSFTRRSGTAGKWVKSCGMVFSASKCYVMRISRLSSSEQYMYQLCDVVLLLVTSEKYLGIYLNHDLKVVTSH